jgi:DNA polymerase III subunit gamma/tau
MSFYRTYRPQTLFDLDNAEVREHLNKLLSSEITVHAFLFSGPKGTGKTSAARIVAKILNCEKLPKVHTRKPTIDNRPASSEGGQLVEPCNECESCRSITEGRHMDVLEIDAASNRGIDDIRDLRERIRLSPSSGKYKVYIIDEVHMLSNEAFNALLKTLEEPPQHAVFILATTDPEELPGTIVSRCVQVQFKRASVEEIVRALTRVAAGEKMSVDPDVLFRIAQVSDGSFRDASKILEQAALEGDLSANAISKLVGQDQTVAQTILVFMKERKTKEALSAILALEQKGSDFRFIVTGMLNILHQSLLSFFHLTLPATESSGIVMTRQEVLAMIKLLSRVYGEVRGSGNPSLSLEVAIVEWCEQEPKTQNSNLKTKM